MGALAQAPMRSRHPPRVRNGTTQQADKSIERQQIRVRLAKGQTHRVMPYSSSLACEAKPGRLASQLVRDHAHEIRPLLELGAELREATATESGSSCASCHGSNARSSVRW